MDTPRLSAFDFAHNPLFNLLMYEMNKNSTFKFMIKEGHR